MKITKVTYGRTIEVGGPFGKRPVERVWFGWEVEAQSPLDTEESMLDSLHNMADAQEEEERMLYRERHRSTADVRNRRTPHYGACVIRKGGFDDLFLQEDGTWGRYGSARRFYGQGAADEHARVELQLTDYGIFP